MNMNRRNFLKTAGLTGVALALADLGFNTKKIEASTKEFKLSGANEYTSICTFCSCGCGMVCHVKDNKLINLEGDPDHIMNEGGLCSKGSAMSVVPNSEERIPTPLYRAPRGNKWQEISWDDALNRIAEKFKKARDENWIEKEIDNGEEYVVNRTDAIGIVGGAQNNNEECYLMAKMARALGVVFLEHQARL